MNKAVFLDRDGTLNYDSNYVYKVDDLQVLPWVKEWLHLLQSKGYLLIIITNQSWIARWYYSDWEFLAFTYELGKQIDISFDAIYYCPHRPEENCECRKPKTKHILHAQKEYIIDLKQSYFIGDKESDMQCGRDAGCKTILLGSDPAVQSDFQTLSFLSATHFILWL